MKKMEWNGMDGMGELGAELWSEASLCLSEMVNARSFSLFPLLSLHSTILYSVLSSAFRIFLHLPLLSRSTILLIWSLFPHSVFPHFLAVSFLMLDQDFSFSMLHVYICFHSFGFTKHNTFLSLFFFSFFQSLSAHFFFSPCIYLCIFPTVVFLCLWQSFWFLKGTFCLF